MDRLDKLLILMNFSLSDLNAQHASKPRYVQKVGQMLNVKRKKLGIKLTNSFANLDDFGLDTGFAGGWSDTPDTFVGVIITNSNVLQHRLAARCVFMKISARFCPSVGRS